MRHCVFLAVLLSLVLSLSKGSSGTTSETSPDLNEPATTTTNASSDTTSETAAVPPETPNTENNGSSGTTSETSPDLNEPATTTTNASSETTSETAAVPPETPNTENNGSSETNNGTITTPPESSNGTTNGSSETTNATASTPPETAPPNNSSSETTNATASTPPETAPPNNSSSETTNATASTPPETAPPNNSSSETTNATASTPPETAPPNNSSSETTNATASTPPETAPPNNTVDFCKNDPCGTSWAECVSLHSNYTCVCRYGFYYDNQDCHRGKIFPGVITPKNNLNNNVQNVNSTEYEELLRNVTEFFRGAFVNLTDYRETVIVEIQPAKEVRNTLPMTVTVTNLFVQNSSVNNANVTAAIDEAARQDSSFVSQYNVTTYCAAFKCDERTTTCEESEFPKCKCKDDFTMTEWDERSCSGCHKDCSEEKNKYCAQEKGVPTCKCMTNFGNSSGECVPCPVGYSGDNCNNNSELILIIVGTVFGAVILALVTAVAVVSVRSKHKPDPEKKSLIRSGHANPNSSGERQSTMFPRVQTTSGHTNPGYQPNNPYGAPSPNRGRFPARDYDDLYEMSREPEGFRMQRRY